MLSLLNLLKVFVILVGILVTVPHQLLEVHANRQVNFVLVGATGNLAQKYLWQNLYDLRKSSLDSGVDITIHGGARANYSAGLAAVQRILTEDVKYSTDVDRQNFLNNVQYHQLKTCGDFETLCQKLKEFNKDLDDESDYCHVEEDKSCDAKSNKWLTPEQIFYLSVPPYTYGELGECISRVCYSKERETKIVLEKPYGSDVQTVDKLIGDLRAIYSDEQVYLVDHYLGKTVVRNILPFRFHSREWLEPYLNRHHVDRIEVVIKEKEDAKGRLNYYDSYGVFLDILQNHAVELLTLAAMDLPSSDVATTSSSEFVQLKTKFLDSLLPITSSDLIYAQYHDYVSHGISEFKNDDFISITPTFGAVMLRSSSDRWSGVPMLLISGKALDAKSSYVRIQFKNDVYFSTNVSSESRQIIFAVSSNYSTKIPKPAIAFSSDFSGSLPNDWVKQGDFFVKLFDQPDQAYFRVIDDVVHARRENFVSLKQLKSSWDIWTLAIPHLNSLKSIKRYQSSNNEVLAFTHTHNGLRFNDENQNTSCKSSIEFDRVTVGSEVEIADKLTQIILQTAKVTLGKKSTFHIAFPGGSSPKFLFYALSAEFYFPWEQTHIWFVDERCTDHYEADSNFNNVNKNLLRHIKLPVNNVHPMPVRLSRGLCVEEDRGVDLYSQLLKKLTENEPIDVIVLGVGSDGHVASIFPHAKESEVNVTLTEAPVDVKVARLRMSLNWPTIKAARLVVVLITGNDKQQVVDELFTGSLPPNEFPVKNLLNESNVYFFIDERLSNVDNQSF
ncbi:6-phosphogluconolactonase [Chamberlinius hualienensis]